MKNSGFDLLIPTFGTMRRELERAFDESGLNGHHNSSAMCPMSIWHDDGYLYISADVPGFTESDLDVQFDDGKLWIRGERRMAEDHPKFEHNERMFGRFERAVRLSEMVDPSTVDASLDNGVLTIRLAKRPEAQPQTIKIRNGSGVKKLSDESSAE